jgi:hypothetical protein
MQGPEVINRRFVIVRRKIKSVKEGLDKIIGTTSPSALISNEDTKDLQVLYLRLFGYKLIITKDM